MTNQHHGFNYIELPSTTNTEMKKFYGAVFGWTFQDWGETYVAIHGAGVDGGFDEDSVRKPSGNGPLVIMFSKNLDVTKSAILAAGGDISVDTYSFPGGCIPASFG